MIANPTTSKIDEIADGIYRISTRVDVVPGGFTFNQFLIEDDEPLLFHTGLRALFPAVRSAVGSILPLESLRYIAFSHVEADECGALNEFLAVAPRAVPVCSRVAALVSVNDLADRPARALADGESLALGRHIGVGLTVEDVRAQRLPLPERDMSPVTLEERIICFADLFYSKVPGGAHIEKTPEAVRKKLASFGAHKVDIFDTWLRELLPSPR